MIFIVKMMANYKINAIFAMSINLMAIKLIFVSV